VLLPAQDEDEQVADQSVRFEVQVLPTPDPLAQRYPPGLARLVAWNVPSVISGPARAGAGAAEIIIVRIHAEAATAPTHPRRRPPHPKFIAKSLLLNFSARLCLDEETFVNS
jgi:hypothetical protein